jgi:transposase InsO family protein
MIDVIESLKGLTEEPYRGLCRDMELPYSSVMRWRTRRKEGKAAVDQPGPRKTSPLDLSTLYDGIRGLQHRKKRTGGSVALFGEFKNQVSRREFHGMVKTVRGEIDGAKEALERRIEWLVPGLVWGMDDMERAWLERYKAYVLLAHDCGSRYAVGIQGDDAKPNGLMTAAFTERLFDEAGIRPLFLKHDRGSNFMSREMQEVLAAGHVIPLISPRHYPPYNGGVERAHQDTIRHVDHLLGGEKADGRTFRLACEVSRHEVNHLCRAPLSGLTACHVFEEARPYIQAYGSRQRREAYEEIETLSIDIVDELGEYTVKAYETAFRYAAETWMQLNNIIRVTRNGVVLPPFYQLWSH